jgi:hypothetical protein
MNDDPRDAAIRRRLRAKLPPRINQAAPPREGQGEVMDAAPSSGLCLDKPRAHSALAKAAPILQRLRGRSGLSTIVRAAEAGLATRHPYCRRVTNAQWIATYGPRELEQCARDVTNLARIVDLERDPEPETPATTKQPDNVIDLMEALKRSLKRHKGEGA